MGLHWEKGREAVKPVCTEAGTRCYLLTDTALLIWLLDVRAAAV